MTVEDELPDDGSSSDTTASTRSQGSDAEATDQVSEAGSTVADSTARLAEMAAKIDPYKGLAEMAAKIDPYKGLQTALAASSAFDALSPSTVLSRSIARGLIAGEERTRRPRLVEQRFISDLLEGAGNATAEIDTAQVLEATLKRSSSTPVPLDDDHLLTDDELAVETWVASVLSNFMSAAGLDERDLLEDSVATLV